MSLVGVRWHWLQLVLIISQRHPFRKDTYGQLWPPRYSSTRRDERGQSAKRLSVSPCEESFAFRILRPSAEGMLQNGGPVSSLAANLAAFQRIRVSIAISIWGVKIRPQSRTGVGVTASRLSVGTCKSSVQAAKPPFLTRDFG